MGIYAAFAHAVAQRRQEMAIRLAIGARPGRVMLLVLRESLAVAAVGILIGWGGALAGGRALEALLFRTSGSDPMTLGAAALTMIAVAAVATLLPAQAASRADPATLLRS